MVSEIISKRSNGELQRYQNVEEFSWADLYPQAPPFDLRAIGEIARLYQVTIIPKNPKQFGWYVFFRLAEERSFSIPMTQGGITFFDRNLAFAAYANAQTEKGLVTVDDDLVVTDPLLEEIVNDLKAAGRLSIAKGEQKTVRFIPISNDLGFASTVEGEVVVNSHFFLMDTSDLDSPFCGLGCPYGLSVHQGVVELPPLNQRPAFFVDTKDRSWIAPAELSELTVEVDGVVLAGERYTRTFGRLSPPSDHTELAIVGRRVVGMKSGGNTPIPMAGFVISCHEEVTITEGVVTYRGYEDIVFAIQVGPSMMKEGRIVDSFCCPFYDSNCHETSFPPTVYPLDFNAGRAARIALGTQKDGKPILLWAEGASKMRYIPGSGSSGVSLLELARFCEEEGYTDIVNLDGGGSAQMLIDGVRHLKISDRYESDEQAERPVPRVLVINRSNQRAD